MSKKERLFEELFPEDAEEYYKLATEFINLDPINYGQAFEVSQKAWAIAERMNELMVNSSKIASLRDIAKTDLQKYFYGKYRQMQLAHEFARIVWNKGESEMKERRVNK